MRVDRSRHFLRLPSKTIKVEPVDGDSRQAVNTLRSLIGAPPSPTTPTLVPTAIAPAGHRTHPHAKEYMDQAITPVAEGELETLEMFGINEAAKAAVTKARREEQALARISA